MEKQIYIPSLAEKEALSYLPLRLSDAVKAVSESAPVAVCEIRLRIRAPLIVNIGGEDVHCTEIVTDEEMRYTVRALCGHSLYSHSETIREGYICTSGGLRAGVCGKAVTENGKIVSVTDISTVAIRIPHRVPGAGDAAYSAIEKGGFLRGVLVFSPPGIGKTTVLRELISLLGEGGIRTAVVDSRYELAAGAEGIAADVLSGYPRAKGMEIAMRLLSPRVIVCDEISTADDLSAVIDCIGGGAAVAASVHGGSFGEVMTKPIVKELCAAGAFGSVIEISRSTGGVRKYKIHSLDEQRCGTHSGR